MTQCLFNDCGWAALINEIECYPGGSNCGSAKFLKASTSDFHDATLQSASDGINLILQSLDNDPSGRKLSFVRTKFGVLLAWTKHPETLSANSVNASSSDEEIILTLRLIDLPGSTNQAS